MLLVSLAFTLNTANMIAQSDDMALHCILGTLSVLEVYAYYDGPKLFASRSNTGSLYLTFWLGDDPNEEWLYVPLSLTRLNYVKSGGISLRDACLHPEDGWLWRGVRDAMSDELKFFSQRPSELSEDDLPSPDAHLSIPTKTLPEIVERADVRAVRTSRNIIDFALTARDSQRNDISILALGNSLTTVQNLIDYIAFSRRGYDAKKGPIPTEIRQSTQLRATNVFASSFGIQLESYTPSDLFGESEVTAAIRNAIGLIQVGADINRLKELFGILGSRVAARYSELLRALTSNMLDLKVSWGSPARPGHLEETSLPFEEAETIARALLKTIDQLSDKFSISCRLEGININRKTFDLVDTVTNQRYTGSVANEYVQTAKQLSARVPAYYNATLELTQQLNSTTGSFKDSYRLIELVEE